MILINNLHGPYDAETSEGRGANAAFNVIRYIEEGKRILEEKAIKLLKGEISIEETMKNEPLENLSKAYIPYMPVNEETERPDFKYGLAFSSVYISAFDSDKDGCITPQEAGPFGDVIDFVAPFGKITPGKFLTWLLFQDCTEFYNGVISPKEAGMSMMLVQREPEFVKNQLKKIYQGHGIDKLEEEFSFPHAVTE